MRKKVILLALVLVVGAPVGVFIWDTVDAAMHGDWTNMKFFGGVVWIETAVYLVLAYSKPNATGQTPAAKKEVSHE